MNRPSAVILAGGLGTRLRSVLPDLPKPMAPVAGRPFLEWVVRFLARQGVQKIVLSTGYKASVVEEHFAHTFVDGVEVRCAPEPAPLGTAGGFLHAVQSVPEPPEAWMILNGDSLALPELAPFFALLDRSEVDAGVLALWMDDAARYGSLDIGADGRLLRFLEKRPGSSWINAGVYLVRHRLLAGFSEKRPLSWETDVFPELLRAGAHVQVQQARGAFLDIGLPESLAQADGFIREHSALFA